MGTVLVVDDEDSVGLIIGRYFRRWRVEQVGSLGEGFERYWRILDLRMVFVDLGLPDSEARCPDAPLRASFALVDRIRVERPRVPVFILSGHLEPALVNAAQLVGAGYLVKMAYHENLMRLAEMLEIAAQVDGWKKATALEWLHEACRATDRELDVVDLVLQGFTQPDIAARLEISVHTVKQHIRVVARRANVTGARGLIELARDIETP